jgi:hypothetical protein
MQVYFQQLCAKIPKIKLKKQLYIISQIRCLGLVYYDTQINNFVAFYVVINEVSFSEGII